MNNYSFLAVVIAAFASLGQLLLKKSVENVPITSVVSFFELLFTWQFLLAVLIYGLCSVSWMVVLSHLNVSVAYPILSLTFVFVPLLAMYALGEPLKAMNFVGILLIVLGVICLFFNQNK